MYSPNNLSEPAQLKESHGRMLAYIEDELMPMRDEQLRWKPNPKKWSVAECAGHLVQAHHPYLERMEKRKSSLKPKKAEFRPGPLGKFFFKLIRVKEDGMPGRTMGAPGFMQPLEDQIKNPHLTLKTLVGQLKQFNNYIDQSIDKNWNGTPVSTSLNPLIKIRWGDAIRFLAAHNERHLLQAQRVTKEAGFPK